MHKNTRPGQRLAQAHGPPPDVRSGDGPSDHSDGMPVTSDTRIFRHSAAWSFAAGVFGFVAVVWALGGAIANGPKRGIAILLVIAAVLGVAGTAYGGWLAWRRRSVVGSLLAGVGVAMSIIALALAIALALVVRW